MGKTTIEQKKNIWYVENKIVYPEVINERELHAIERGVSENLLPIRIQHKKKAILLKSTISGLIPLKTYLSSIMTKKMFLGIVYHLVTIVKECEQNLMNTSNLMLNLDYIFIEPRTKRVTCLFWPIVNNQHPHYPSEFFKEMPFHVVFAQHENLDYIKVYIQYFKSGTPFSINRFEKMILELMGKTAENNKTVFSGPTNQAYQLNHGVKVEKSNEHHKDIAYNPLEMNRNHSVSGREVSVFCPKCGELLPKSSKFCSNCGLPLYMDDSTRQIPLMKEEKTELNRIQTENFSETTVLGETTEGTTVLGADMLEEPSFPYLIREKTGEKIHIDKPSFRIGKERQYCDYFIFDNSSISRSHADIITKNGRYFVMDHNSTNKTYVDGRVIPIHQEIEIFSGTKLKLANEEFTFYI